MAQIEEAVLHCNTIPRLLICSMTLMYDLSPYCISYPSRPVCHIYERFPQINGRQASVSVSIGFLIEVFNIILTV
jgi:hypothetical protein